MVIFYRIERRCWSPEIAYVYDDWLKQGLNAQPYEVHELSLGRLRTVAEKRIKSANRQDDSGKLAIIFWATGKDDSEGAVGALPAVPLSRVFMAKRL